MILPEAFINQLIQLFGENRTKLIIDATTLKSNPSIRVNPNKNYQVPNDSTPIEWSLNGYYINKQDSFALDPNWHAGAYYVQESSSQFIAHICRHLFDDSAPIHALDLCASPGGKTLILADSLPKGSLIISNEAIKGRVAALIENVTRWGNSRIWVTQSDPSVLKNIPNSFDLLLIDAPCSGEGMFRKDPAAANYWNHELVQICTLRQQRILSDSISCLKPGGVLIYSTCTLNDNENEKQIQQLLDSGEFETIPLDIPINWNVRSTIMSNGISQNCLSACYRFCWDSHPGEGFFVAVLRKISTSNMPNKSYSSKKRLEIFKTEIPWQPDSSEWTLIKHNEDIRAISTTHFEFLESIRSHLFIIKAGTLICDAKNYRPSHELALQTDLNIELPRIDINLSDALTFLRKQNLHLESQNIGFHTLSYQSNPLGWVKILNGRINSLLPARFRLFMQ